MTMKFLNLILFYLDHLPSALLLTLMAKRYMWLGCGVPSASLCALAPCVWLSTTCWAHFLLKSHMKK